MFKDGTLPDVCQMNKMFFPRKATIRNNMIHSRRRLCYALIDQECLEHKYKNERKQVIQLRYISDPKASWIQLT